MTGPWRAPGPRSGCACPWGARPRLPWRDIIAGFGTPRSRAATGPGTSTTSCLGCSRQRCATIAS
eukprot:1036994-Lingulodinium_polyedra.AAC.1